MRKRSAPNLEGELRVFTIGVERVTWLGDLIASARADYKPRNFGERHLVDDLAVSKWRGLRVALMEKAVFDTRAAAFVPASPGTRTAASSCRTKTFTTSPWPEALPAEPKTLERMEINKCELSANTQPTT